MYGKEGGESPQKNKAFINGSFSHTSLCFMFMCFRVGEVAGCVVGESVAAEWGREGSCWPRPARRGMRVPRARPRGASVLWIRGEFRIRRVLEHLPRRLTEFTEGQAPWQPSVGQCGDYVSSRACWDPTCSFLLGLRVLPVSGAARSMETVG